MTRTTEINVSNKKSEIRETAHHDSRGRLIGGQVWTWESDWVECDRLGWSVEPGHYFSFTTHSTRDRVNYGASQKTYRFASAAERDAAVEKYFVGVAKRAAKNA